MNKYQFLDIVALAAIAITLWMLADRVTRLEQAQKPSTTVYTPDMDTILVRGDLFILRRKTP